MMELPTGITHRWHKTSHRPQVGVQSQAFADRSMAVTNPCARLSGPHTRGAHRQASCI
jgi:hypothetical protein